MTRVPSLSVWLLTSLLVSGCSTTKPMAEPNIGTSLWKRVSAQSTTRLDDLKDSAATASQPTPPRTEYFQSSPPHASDDKNATAAAVGERDGERYELNFSEADVRGVIDAVLGDILKLDYVVSPAVQGRITFRTSRAVAKSSLLPALEAALGSVSVALVETGRSVQVVPMDEAPLRVRGAHVATPAMPAIPGYAVEILPLRFINANEMKSILESFVPKGTVLQADAQHGHLVIAGSSQDRAAVMRTVETFDVDWLQGMNFALYRLDQTRPEAVVNELRTIFQGKLDLFSTRVRLVPLDRMRAVLGIARSKADLELVNEWVARLDASKGGEQRIFVYNVQNGSAKDLVASLRQVLTGEAVSTQARVESSVPAPGQGLGEQRGAEVQATAESAANVARLVAVEENNSLLFYGTEDEFRVIKEALRQIDVLPRQVMIEAILAEVTLNDNLRYGVQWFFDSGENTVTLSAADTGTVSSQFPGFSYIYSGRADARIVLNALQSKTEVKILSAPKISVLNNQKASLQVGDQVPIVTQTSQSTDTAGAPVVNTIQMRDTGVILEVTPRVNDNGNVILDVTQEVSEVAQTTSSGIDSPTIQRRKIHSVVATRDGFTVALGGLIRENGSRGNSGVPLLKDVPVVGNLFKSNSFESRRTELVVLLVPHVMRNQTETQAVVDALVDGVRAASHLADHAPPLVPPKRQ